MTSNRRDGNGSRPARIPPHNLEAEAAVLGAALITPAAVDALGTCCAPEDFYRPAHQHIAAAIVELAAGDRPVDVVTVGDALRRAGVLEEIGDTAALHALQNATPSLSNAPSYARIVHDTAVLRRLIHTATSIADLGYSGVGDPTAAVAAAGELLNRMDPGDAASLSTLDVADVAALLATDLTPEEPALLARSDGAALLYPGKTHTFQAEPSAGKTWLSCWTVAETLRIGGAAAYLDYEDTAPGLLGRLRTLGVPDEAVAERFVYMQPAGRIGPAERLELFRRLEALNPDLVVVDSVGVALQRQGLSEDRADDFLAWYHDVPLPIARTGAAVLMLDHLAKDPETRGRWARGTGAKLGAVDGVAYQVKVRMPFSRHRAGRVDLVIAKDRPGGVGAIGETAAEVHVEPHGAGELVTVRIEPFTADKAASDTWKPTRIMGQLMAELEHAAAPLSASALKSMVHAKPRLVTDALARLRSEGYVADGPGRTLRVVRPYNGAPANGAPAPAWRIPPPELDFQTDDDGPTPDDVAEVDRARPVAYYNHPDF